MYGEINNRGANVTAVASHRHAESVLFVIEQLWDLQAANMIHDYQTASAEIDRLGVPAAAILGFDVAHQAKNHTSDIFVLTLIGERLLRSTHTQTQETMDDERGTDGRDPA